MINKITKLLAEICNGKSQGDKMLYLNQLGFANFKELQDATVEQHKIVLTKLQDKLNDVVYVTVNHNGILTTRPVKPTHINQISFRIKK